MNEHYDEREREEAENCPWGWCEGDPYLHHDLLCIPSKALYGVSWAWSRDPDGDPEGPEEPADAWEVNDDGHIIGLKQWAIDELKGSNK